VKQASSGTRSAHRIEKDSGLEMVGFPGTASGLVLSCSANFMTQIAVLKCGDIYSKVSSNKTESGWIHPAVRIIEHGQDLVKARKKDHKWVTIQYSRPCGLEDLHFRRAGMP
jgi:hypothetical protein